MTDVLAWHFVRGTTLRDGRPLPPVGETLRHDGPLEMCVSGLHGSERLIDALGYAPGETLCRVRLSGEIIRDTDKCCASERTILWILSEDVTCPILHECACWCAEQALKLIPHPDPRSLAAIATKRRWLRNQATDAELAAAWTAAMTAARTAARAAAWAAAGAAAWAAALAAALAAAGAAARTAARTAALAAAWAAAGAAAWAAQNDHLTELVRCAASSAGLDVEAR